MERLLLAALFLVASGFGLPRPASASVADAVSAYDAGDYVEACRILREADSRGALDGPLLYRLFFCSNATGDPEAARAALERAASVLESENVPGCRVEIPFYLANAYANLGRAADARRVAEETLVRLDGDTFRPGTPMEWFQVGKLAQDAGRNDRAEAAYGRAVDGFASGTGAPGHERWGRRFLGGAALGRADFAAALPHWKRVVELGGADRSDLLALATAAARTAAWDEAAEAWRRAEKIDMANGSDPRYASALARQAAALGSLPATDAGGKPWGGYDQKGLEAALEEAASAARALRADAMAREADGSWDSVARAEATARLREIRGRFLAAGIEYAVRRLPLRETAFAGQYATLVFQEADWQLPEVAGADVRDDR